MDNHEEEKSHAVAPSDLTDVLCRTLAREDALWRVFSGQGISHMAGTAKLLEKNGLIHFSRNWATSEWRITEKGKLVLFTWMPELKYERHNVELTRHAEG